MGALPVLVLVVGACSSPSDRPVDEYPPLGTDPGTEPVDGGPMAPGDRARDAGNDTPAPAAGKKLLSTPVFLEGATTDGHLVFEEGSDLRVWPAGEAAPVTIQKDFYAGEDTMLVRGRFVAVWLAGEASAHSLLYWSKASGVVTVPGDATPLAIYPRPASDDVAYVVRGSGSFRETVKVTRSGAGPAVTVAEDLALGYPERRCARSIGFVGAELLVAGCPNGATTPSVRVHALDGSRSRAILEDSRPGVWPNHARTRVLLQNETTSWLRPIAGAGPNLRLDGPVRDAVFSRDDAKVVYLDASGKVKRASTDVPVPVELATAKALLDVSPDGRFAVIATKGDLAKRATDLVVVDANAPAAPRVLAPDAAASFGLSSDGTKLVYVAPRGLGLAGPLYVVSLPGGTPQKIADAAEDILFSGDVVYFQQRDPATKTMTLLAARVASPQDVQTIERGLEPLTSHAVVVGDKLYVAGKLGLWEYPALSP